MSSNLEIGVGETLELSIAYYDDDDAPIILTGHTVTFKLLQPNAPGASPIATQAATISGNSISVTIANSVTAGWADGTYVFLITDTFGGKVKWLTRAKIDVIEASTIV